MTKYVSLIVSHNNRIQCLLDKLVKNKNQVKIRFQSCAILRLSINKTNWKLELVYSGELSNSERTKVSEQNPYYTTFDVFNKTPIRIGYKVFDNYDFPIFDYGGANDLFYDNLNLKINDIGEDEYVFYIVRHGQSEHNKSYNLGFTRISSTFGLKMDTRVTSAGENQAFNAGKELYVLLKKIYKEDINVWFASDLFRSRQTITEIIAGINTASGSEYMPNLSQIVILPCSSEINTSGTGNGDCDSVSASSMSLSKISRENYPECTKSDIVDNEQNRNSLKGCFKIKGIPLFWDFYLLFYGNDIRGQNDTIYGTLTSRRSQQNQLKQLCRNTNMISMAIFYIKYYKLYEYYNTDAEGRNTFNQSLKNHIENYIKERNEKKPLVYDESLNSRWSENLGYGGKYKRKSIKKNNKKSKNRKPKSNNKKSKNRKTRKN